MKLFTTWFGVFLLDDDNRIADKIIFRPDAGEIVAKLRVIEEGKILQEERTLAACKVIQVCEPRLAELGDLIVFSPLDIKPEDYGFSLDILSKAMLLKGREEVKSRSTPDEQIVQAIRAIDDLAKIINLLSERLHEWVSLNFPELGKMVSDAKYVELVAEFGERRAMFEAGAIKPMESLGADISPHDADALKSLARTILQTVKEKQDVERYIEARMKELAPNLSHIAGPLIGARLISLTGGLERLARLPSSTIQLLGAEKALFKHLKENAKPPKHGVIFQHPLIHRSPLWQRGKIARAFAGKISIAARADWNRGRFIAPELEADLNQKVKEIGRKYPSPRTKSQAKKSRRRKPGR